MINGIIGPDLMRALSNNYMQRWNDKFLKIYKEISDNSENINIVLYPYYQYKLFKSKNYTFWLMPKTMIGKPEFSKAIMVRNPNPTEIDQFKTPGAPQVQKQNPYCHATSISEHEKNFSQVHYNL